MRKTVTLFFALFLIGCATTTEIKVESDFVHDHQEVIELHSLVGDTLTLAGNLPNVGYAPKYAHRWTFFRNGELYNVYQETRQGLRTLINPGVYEIIRYTDYYANGGQVATVKSNTLSIVVEGVQEYSE